MIFWKNPKSMLVHFTPKPHIPNHNIHQQEESSRLTPTALATASSSYQNNIRLYFRKYPVPGQEQSRVSYFVQCLDFKLKDIVVRFVGEKDVTSVTFPANVALTDRSTIYALVEYADKLDQRQRSEIDFNTNIPTTIIYSHFEGVTTLPITMLPLRLTKIRLDRVITTTNTYWCWTLRTGKGHYEYEYPSPPKIPYHPKGAHTANLSAEE